MDSEQTDSTDRDDPDSCGCLLCYILQERHQTAEKPRFAQSQFFLLRTIKYLVDLQHEYELVLGMTTITNIFDEIYKSL